MPLNNCYPPDLLDLSACAAGCRFFDAPIGLNKLLILLNSFCDCFPGVYGNGLKIAKTRSTVAGRKIGSNCR
jgi:hypothetical protein